MAIRVRSSSGNSGATLHHSVKGNTSMTFSAVKVILVAAAIILLYQLSNLAMDVLYKQLNPPAWGS